MNQEFKNCRLTLIPSSWSSVLHSGCLNGKRMVGKLVLAVMSRIRNSWKNFIEHWKIMLKSNGYLNIFLFSVVWNLFSWMNEIFLFLHRTMWKLIKELKETNMLICLPKQEQLTTRWRPLLEMFDLNLIHWRELKKCREWAVNPANIHSVSSISRFLTIIKSKILKFLMDFRTSRNLRQAHLFNNWYLRHYWGSNC